MEQDLKQYAVNLVPGEDGIWTAAPVSAVSYPSEGNAVLAALEERSFWFNHRNRMLLQLLGRFEPPGALFDIGGGNGFVSRAFQEAGHEAVLVEPGRAGAERARERGVAKVICASFQDAGFRKGSLPAAGLFDVLEHIEKDEAFLVDLRQAMATEGRLYLTVPAYRSLWSGEDVEAGHFRRYTRGELLGKLRSNGFDVEYCTHMFSFLWLPILLGRALPYRLGIKPRQLSERQESAHRPPSALVSRIIEAFMGVERTRIAKGGLPMGTSIVAVARAR